MIPESKEHQKSDLEKSDQHENRGLPLQNPGIISPRKLPNPCLESSDHKNLHRELLFNQKIGKNVLNRKSELQRALEKHKEQQVKKEIEQQKHENRSVLEKVIEERAKRIEQREKPEDENKGGSEEEEFKKVHARLQGKKN